MMLEKKGWKLQGGLCRVFEERGKRWFTLHCAISSPMTWMMEDGPPRDPNRSSSLIASRAAWVETH